ncbi:DUF2807 domain-containing protein, partial [Bacteroidales bacterium OttesenSCG-928-I14]|nr:DUF2807 domain-containing protein [Bacteroidales bacterium OttesenSCG-928-I14]
LANISLVFIILIPVLSILYSIVGYFAKFKPLHSSIKWGTFIIWIIALVAFFSSGIRFDSERFKEYVDREDRVYRVDDDNFITYENDDMTDRVESLPLINSIKVSGGLSARLEIEQKDISETCLHISADKDIIDDIRAKVDNKGRLVLESKKDIWFLRNRKKILIRLETPDLNDIQVDGANDVVFVGAFRSKEIDIEVNGAGNIYADSLYVDNVKTHIRGAGDVKLAGEAKFVDFNIAGAGDVRALNLVADTVVVETNGAGDVHCNPIKYLDAKIRGAGEIRYKEEPENKNVSSVGVGSIGKK